LRPRSKKSRLRWRAWLLLLLHCAARHLRREGQIAHARNSRCNLGRGPQLSACNQSEFSRVLPPANGYPPRAPSVRALHKGSPHPDHRLSQPPRHHRRRRHGPRALRKFGAFAGEGAVSWPRVNPRTRFGGSGQNAFGNPGYLRTPFAVCRLTIAAGSTKRRFAIGLYQIL
jgi:hypothetical protein